MLTPGEMEYLVNQAPKDSNGGPICPLKHNLIAIINRGKDTNFLGKDVTYDGSRSFLRRKQKQAAEQRTTETDDA